MFNRTGVLLVSFVAHKKQDISDRHTLTTIHHVSDQNDYANMLCLSFQKIEFKGVPLDAALGHLANSNSVNEALKIFFDDSTLSEEDISVIMNIKQHGPLTDRTRHDGYVNDGNLDEQNGKCKQIHPNITF